MMRPVVEWPERELTSATLRFRMVPYQGVNMHATKRLGLLAVAWLVGGVAPALAGAENLFQQDIDGAIDWVYSYAEGRKQAKETGKPLFVVFRCER